MNVVEKVSKLLAERPRSFHSIRQKTGLKLSDDQFMAMIRANEGRLAFARFRRTDDAGNRVRPGWPGMKLKPSETA